MPIKGVEVATYDTVGGIKPFYSNTAAVSGITAETINASVTVNARTATSGRYYPVEVDAEGRAYVNVPWTDSNTNNQVSQYSTTTDASYPLLFKYASGTTSTSTTTNYSRYNNGVYVNPSTGTITASKFDGEVSPATQTTFGGIKIWLSGSSLYISTEED